ncbi:hypothetical protein HPB50_018585 [Hyalomma asiaticum]|uniref:Uncharacterized protein n=1 Tax=Hyalomma asiaticum TaxID=266040 RepID=A0ACB7SL35_HYAAI|nr:hypothetical protein HPB50_018585 [Hyalomma asiaticum]
MTEQVTGEPVLVARSSSSDCVNLCTPSSSQTCSTKSTAKRGDDIPQCARIDDASSTGSFSGNSSKIDESPKTRYRASGHLQSGAETSLKSVEDDSSVTNFDDSSSILVPLSATKLSDRSQDSADRSPKTGARCRRKSSSSVEDLLSEGAVAAVESLEASAHATPPAATCPIPSTEPPVPIQGQLELLLHNPDNTDTTRSSEMDSQSMSATHGYGYSEANGSTLADHDASTLSTTRHSDLQASSLASTSTATGTRADVGGPERSEEEPSASSALSTDRSPVTSGSSSPGTQPSGSRRIKWGKAKCYPGSETVSELEDERSADFTAQMRAYRRRQAAMTRAPVRPLHRLPPQMVAPQQTQCRYHRNRMVRVPNRSCSRSRFERDREWDRDRDRRRGRDE